MTAVYGLYPDGGLAQRAVDELRAGGYAPRDITVLSSEPREDQEFGHADARSWMWWIACAGGLIGFLSATALLLYGERSWPIDVGGLPIVAWWPNLIIMFELTMLGAIFATVITLMVTAIWGDRHRRLYDPRVSDGLILVGIEDAPPDKVEALRRALETGAGVEVRVKEL